MSFFDKVKKFAPKSEPAPKDPIEPRALSVLNMHYMEQSVADWVLSANISNQTLNVIMRPPKSIDPHALFEALKAHVGAQGFDALNLEIKQKPKPAPHPRIGRIIAVGSGKGGVGKSTTCANLALALGAQGARVGVLDADIYGPSMPMILGARGRVALEDGKFIPFEAHGLAVLSIGHLLSDDDTPIAWRGIKATGALMQLYGDTAWPPLDYLLIDLPPGTGDIALTLAQKIPVDGAIIITTPQNVALLDAAKGLQMFVKTDIDVIGVIENMALHICEQCGHAQPIFGAGGGDELSARYRVPLLGQLPLDVSICAHADSGVPIMLTDSPLKRHYNAIAKKSSPHCPDRKSVV